MTLTLTLTRALTAPVQSPKTANSPALFSKQTNVLSRCLGRPHAVRTVATRLTFSNAANQAVPFEERWAMPGGSARSHGILISSGAVGVRHGSAATTRSLSSGLWICCRRDRRLGTIPHTRRLSIKCALPESTPLCASSYVR